MHLVTVFICAFSVLSAFGTACNHTVTERFLIRGTSPEKAHGNMETHMFTPQEPSCPELTDMRHKPFADAARQAQYRREGHWGNATLADYWNMAVLSVPERQAVVDLQGDTRTYAELDAEADCLASFLVQSGVQPGDVVSFQLPGWMEFTLVSVACLKARAVLNPLLPNLRAAEVSYAVNKCGSKVLFVPVRYRKFAYAPLVDKVREQCPLLREVVMVEKDEEPASTLSLREALTASPLPALPRAHADDLATLLFTSGSEGFPKGVMLSHNNIIASERAFAATLNITYLDTMLMPAPVAHATGFHHGVVMSFILGATCVLQDMFTPMEALRLIEREHCTCTMGSTPFLYDILTTLCANSFDISSLRFFMCGGAPVPPHLVDEAHQRGFKVICVYGSSESVPHTAVRPDDSPTRSVFSDGKALPGIEVKVVDKDRNEVPPGVEGEEASRGPNVFMGYLNEPERTAKLLEDGWYYSGDLCVMDEDGYIRITGRKKDVIVRGGENISSVEVENILLRHKAVREAAVVAMPDPRLGERACAFVVLEPGVTDLSIDDIIEFFVKNDVAKYKIPERIEVMKQFPRTASGKVKKFILREKAALFAPLETSCINKTRLEATAKGL